MKKSTALVFFQIVAVSSLEFGVEYTGGVLRSMIGFDAYYPLVGQLTSSLLYVLLLLFLVACFPGIRETLSAARANLAKAMANRVTRLPLYVFFAGLIIAPFFWSVSPAGKPAASTGWYTFFGMMHQDSPATWRYFFCMLLPQSLDRTLLAPLGEELMCVSIFLVNLRKLVLPVWAPFAINAACFTAGHFIIGAAPAGLGLGIAAIIVYSGTRLFYDLLYVHTQCVYVPILAHMLWNLRVECLHFIAAATL